MTGFADDASAANVRVERPMIRRKASDIYTIGQHKRRFTQRQELTNRARKRRVPPVETDKQRPPGLSCNRLNLVQLVPRYAERLFDKYRLAGAQSGNR